VGEGSPVAGYLRGCQTLFYTLETACEQVRAFLFPNVCARTQVTWFTSDNRIMKVYRGLPLGFHYDKPDKMYPADGRNPINRTLFIQFKLHMADLYAMIGGTIQVQV